MLAPSLGVICHVVLGTPNLVCGAPMEAREIVGIAEASNADAQYGALIPGVGLAFVIMDTDPRWAQARASDQNVLKTDL